MTPLLHAIGNAHIDPVWLWRWTEGLETIRATFQSVLDRMDEYPGFVFSGSSAAFYAWLRDTDPGMFERVRARVREGRWEIVGGWWIQPDANVPCGESLARQALYGQRFFQEAFGVTATVGYNPDTFGHAGGLPQILRGAGLSRYCFLRPGPHEKTLPGNVFWWESPDGSRVLAARIAHSYGSWAEQLGDHIQACHAARPDYVSDFCVYYGVGNHGGGPTKANIESILARAGSQPAVALSTLGAFFSAVEAEAAAGAAVPVVADDLQHHARGCYTAESEVKRQNRRVEHLLMNAERIACVASAAAGRPYPQADLTAAWQSLLFNQFHDILAGSSLPEGYADARDWFGHAATLGGRALHMSLQAVTGRIDTRGKGDALVIFNPLPWEATVPVEVERGSATLTDSEGNPVAGQAVQATTVVGQRRSCFVATLPGLGYRVFRQDPDADTSNPLFKHVGRAPSPAGDSALQVGCDPDGRAGSPAYIANQFYHLEVDPATGWLTRLYDKRRGVEVLAGPANVGVVVDDPSDTWSHDVVSFRNEAGRFADAQIAIDEDGPVRAALRIETRWGRSTLLQRLYLYRDLDLIECRASVNWQEQGRMLKLAFPLNLDAPRATYDGAYGSLERPCNGEEEPGQQWIDVTGTARLASGETADYGVSLLNDCKYGFDVLGSEMRMSVLRSPIYAQHDPWKPEAGRAYVHQDQGWQTVTYRLLPHLGGWQAADVARRAWELNAPPLWVNEHIHGGTLPAGASFLAAEPGNIVLSVCKRAEDSEAWVVRGYESAGRATRATLRMPQAGMAWEADFRPHELNTFVVDLAARAARESDLLA